MGSTLESLKPEARSREEQGWDKVDAERLPTSLAMPFPIGRNPAQWCPSAIAGKFEVQQQRFHKEVANKMKEGSLYVGFVAIPVDIEQKSQQKAKEVLWFHALQRAVQVLRGRPHTSAEFLRGITAGSNLVDVVQFKLNTYALREDWHKTQMRLYDELTEKYGADIATIREYFDIEIKPIFTEKNSDYRSYHGEDVCLYKWYAIFLKPKKKKPMPEDTRVGDQMLEHTFVEAWADTQRAFEQIGIRGIPETSTLQIVPTEQKQEAPQTERIRTKQARVYSQVHQ